VHPEDIKGWVTKHPACPREGGEGFVVDLVGYHGDNFEDVETAMHVHGTLGKLDKRVRS
jgi:hypothetical protein